MSSVLRIRDAGGTIWFLKHHGDSARYHPSRTQAGSRCFALSASPRDDHPPAPRWAELADALMSGTMRQVTDRATVGQWLAGYEAAWRAPGSGDLADLFTGDATYLKSPYEQPLAGLDAIKRMWEEEREGPDEVFTLITDILAVDGPTAVVRAEVRYGDPPGQEYRDLWVIRLAGDGRCTWFEEWPYWPGRPYTAPDDLA
jgi:ketosteroid isomerase-like protein